MDLIQQFLLKHNILEIDVNKKSEDSTEIVDAQGQIGENVEKLQDLARIQIPKRPRDEYPIFTIERYIQLYGDDRNYEMDTIPEVLLQNPIFIHLEEVLSKYSFEQMSQFLGNLRKLYLEKYDLPEDDNA